jgi:nitroreductase
MTEELLIRLRKIADTDYEIFPLLKQRYSPHIFKKDSINDNQIHKLFEAGRWAPSRDNSQPWRFLYAHAGTASFAMIVDCLNEDNKKWAAMAPLLILSAYRKKGEGGQEKFYAMHDLGLCLGNMAVQAQYMGIGLHHIAGIDRKRVQELFKIPKDYSVATAIAAGYYGGDFNAITSEVQKMETEERHRLPQAEFVSRENWNFR